MEKALARGAVIPGVVDEVSRGSGRGEQHRGVTKPTLRGLFSSKMANSTSQPRRQRARQAVPGSKNVKISGRVPTNRVQHGRVYEEIASSMKVLRTKVEAFVARSETQGDKQRFQALANALGELLKHMSKVEDRVSQVR